MKNNTIVNSIEKIEPKKDAEKKMYNNIIAKSKRKPRKAAPIKMIRMALPIAACICITVIGIIHFHPSNDPITNPGDSAPTDFLVQVGAPGYGEATLDDIERLGYTVNIPQDAEAVYYSLYDGKLASVDFLLDNHAYTLWASSQSGDFSGLDGAISKEISIHAKTDAKLYQLDSYTNLYWKASWTDGKNTYYLTNTDCAEESTMIELCRFMAQ